METEGQLPSSKGLTASFYPEPNQSSRYHPNSKIFILLLLFIHVLLPFFKGLFRFPIILYAFLSSSPVLHALIISLLAANTARSMIEETWQQRRADTTFLTDCCCNCRQQNELFDKRSPLGGLISSLP
jgi:hypothetical protein